MSIDRKIDVDKLTEEQLQTAIDTLGTQLRKDVDDLCDKYKKKLGRYGLSCRMDVAVNTEDFFNGDS